MSKQTLQCQERPLSKEANKCSVKREIETDSCQTRHFSVKRDMCQKRHTSVVSKERKLPKQTDTCQNRHFSKQTLECQKRRMSKETHECIVQTEIGTSEEHRVQGSEDP